MSSEPSKGAQQQMERCIFCLQQLDSMSDPRELPCTHVFCLECLEANPHTSGIECRACRTFHKGVQASNLPKAVVNHAGFTATEEEEELDELAESDTHQTAPSCDRCEVETAVCYCLDCGDKICQTHLEHHKAYFGNSHQTVSIKLYQSRPNFYIKPHCSVHSKRRISMICQRCYKQNCSQCKSENNCGILPGTAHIFKSLEDIRQEIVDQFEALLKTTEKKMSELCKEEKVTWDNLDQEIDSLKGKIDNIDKLANEKITEIKRKAEEAKSQVITCIKARKDQVENFLTKLHDDMNRLQNTHREMRRFLADNHVTQLVLVRDEKLSELTVVNDLKQERCDLKRMIFSTEGVRTSLFPSLKIRKFPNISLQHQHQVNQNSFFQPKLIPDQKLIMTDNSTISCFNANGVQVWEANVKDVLALTYHRNMIYYIIDTPDERNSLYCCTIHQADTNTKQAFQNASEMITDIELTGQWETRKLFAHEDYLATISIFDNYDDTVLLTIFEQTNWEMICYVERCDSFDACFDADGDVLMLTSEDTVSKCRIDITTKKLNELWQCSDLQRATAVCHSSGITYVSGAECIYVISMFGELVGNIPLPGIAYQIDILDNLLAVASHDTVDIFKID